MHPARRADNRFVSNRLWRTGGIFLYQSRRNWPLAVPTGSAGG